MLLASDKSCQVTVESLERALYLFLPTVGKLDRFHIMLLKDPCTHTADYSRTPSNYNSRSPVRFLSCGNSDMDVLDKKICMCTKPANTRIRCGCNPVLVLHSIWQFNLTLSASQSFAPGVKQPERVLRLSHRLAEALISSSL